MLSDMQYFTHWFGDLMIKIINLSRQTVIFETYVGDSMIPVKFTLMDFYVTLFLLSLVIAIWNRFVNIGVSSAANGTSNIVKKMKNKRVEK